MMLIGLATGTKSYAQWQLTGNANATSTSLLGTTNAIPLSLATKNIKRLVIDTTGRVGIGTSTPVNILTVKGSGGTPAASWVNAGAPLFVGFGENTIGNADYILSMASAAANARPVIVGRRSRGTLAAPTVVSNNDFLMSVLASGYDGSSFQNPASIDIYVDGVPSVGNVPGRISMVTGSNGGNRAERMRISSNGDVSINNNQFNLTKATGNVLIGGGIFSVTKSANIKGIAGVHGDTLAGTALYVGADSATNGIVVKDPKNKYVLYASKSGINEGIYITKSSTTSATACIAGAATGTSVGIEGLSILGDAVQGNSDSSNGVIGYSAGYVGVYGSTGNAASFAGYFNGDVYSTGMYSGSDARLKNNIQDFDNALQLINALQPKHYSFRNDGKYALMHLPVGNHYGLIAQDLEKVLPTLVKESRIYVKDYAKKDRTKDAAFNRGEAIDYKAVNYTELIPIMIKAMQEISGNNEELKIINDELKTKNDELESRLSKLETMMNVAKPASAGKQQNILLSSVSVEQNVPNPPVNNTTKISYNIPANAAKAEMMVADIYGKKIKQITLANRGKGTVSMDTTGLAAGTYTYTLFVDGKMIETKKMIMN